MSADSSEEQRKTGRGSHPNSLAAGTGNLIPYKPGQSGNPGGVRKGTVLPAEAYKRLGAIELDRLREYEPRNAIEAGTKNLLLRAAESKSWKAAHAAIKEIADRIEGKPIQRKVDVTESELVAAARRDYELGKRYVEALNDALEQELCCASCTARIRQVFAESDLIGAILATTDERYHEAVRRELEAMADGPIN